MKKKVPAYNGTLRDHTIMCPYCISECSGIRIFGKRIKSIAFSTDVAIIKNINADAIIAVYPFTPQAAISQSIISISDVPVFVGVGGGLTGGKRSVRLALQAEHQGAYGVVSTRRSRMRSSRRSSGWSIFRSLRRLLRFTRMSAANWRREPIF